MNGINLTGRIDLNALKLRNRINVLGEQISTGRTGKTYGDLGAQAAKSLDLRADMGRLSAYQSTIDQTLTKLKMTQTTMDRLGAIAEKFLAGTVNLTGVTKSEEVQLQAASARQAMTEVASLLNEQFNGEYLFGGTDTRNPPIPNPSQIASGGMATNIATAISGLTGSNIAATLAATRAAAQSNTPGITPFSEFLSDSTRGLTEARRALPCSDTERVEYGLFANRNAAVESVGETTGSWSRDLLRGLASIAALTPDKTQIGSGFTDFISGIQSGLKSSVAAMSLERGALGLVENRLSTIQDQNQKTMTLLTTQVADIEEVDVAQAITSMQATQMQLEASYRAMSLTQQLTLTRFLG